MREVRRRGGHPSFYRLRIRGAWATGEKLCYPRIQASQPVRYSPKGYPKATIGSTVNLSAGGTKIESLQALTPNEKIKMSIGIGSQVIECQGKVIYVSEPENQKIRAGIKFEGFPNDDWLCLRRYLSRTA